MIILTDVDGVLLDWNTSFEKFMLSEYGLTLIPDQANRYSLSKRFGVNRDEMDDYVNEFNQSSRVSKLTPFKDSKTYMDKLISDGHRFIAITNVGTHIRSTEYRTENLVDVFGDVFDEVICLKLGASKFPILSRWENSNMFWLEDKFTNALDGHSLGLRSILIDADYNKDFSTSRFPRVCGPNPWEQIYQLISKEA
jgi:uncharacterized HAD superfamily protein